MEPNSRKTFGSLAERVEAATLRLNPNAQTRVDGALELEAYLAGEHRAELDLRQVKALCDLEPERSDVHIESFVRAALIDPWASTTRESIASAAQEPGVGQDDGVSIEPTQRQQEPRHFALRCRPCDRARARRTSRDASFDLGRARGAPPHQEGGTRSRARQLERIVEGFHLKRLTPGLLSLAAGDSFDAARVLLHEQWQNVLLEVDSHLLVAPAGRDLVYVTGTESEHGVRALRAALEAERNQPTAPYPITTGPSMDIRELGAA